MKYSNIYGATLLGALMFAPILATAQTVTSFTVVNADTGADIATFASGGTISVKDTPNINLRANATGVKSVVFTDATTTKQIENTAPYAYKGNSGPRYFKWSPSAGTYVIKAAPFASSGGKGTAGPVAILTLKLTNDAPNTSTPPTPAGTQTFNLTYQAAPADNPLKGFLPYEGTHSFPHSMEWFYIPLSDIQKGFTTFDWQKLDESIAKIAGRGHQAVFRVFLDYPSRKNTGVPDFLAASLTNVDGNGRKTPDYNNADLQKAILNFIPEFGKRYDKDIRVGFITAGLLGFWGEWHTYPHDWMPKAEFKKQVVDAYDKAFPTKHILFRGPVEATNPNRRGFHDDSFAYTTLPPVSWHFWPRMTGAGLTNFWKTHPMGGEVRPEVQGCTWDEVPCNPEGQNFDLSVATTHASWMINHGTVAHSQSPERTKRAIAGAQSMGYTLHVPKATVTSSSVGQPLSGSVTLENRGVAPFYYPWVVQVAARDSSGKLYSWPQSWDLRLVLPGSPTLLNFNITNPGLSAGNYTLMIGVPNPMSGGKPLKFGNTTQDKDQSGWLTLGSFTVK